MNWCIIIPILATLLGALFGWLLRHLTCNCEDDLAEIENLRARNRKLKTELQDCLSIKNNNVAIKQPRQSFENKLASDDVPELASLSSKTKEVEPNLLFDANLAKLSIGKKVVGDDLKVIEGIGPKIAELFNNNGVNTWYQLSKTSVERCQEILNSGGKRFEIHKPDTWPKQSRLAFEGKWEELKDLQDYLDGGREKA